MCEQGDTLAHRGKTTLDSDTPSSTSPSTCECVEEPVKSSDDGSNIDDPDDGNNTDDLTSDGDDDDGDNVDDPDEEEEDDNPDGCGKADWSEGVRGEWRSGEG